MKALFLGGTGLLSGATLKVALAQGWEMTVLNRGRRNEGVPEGVESLKGDFTDAGQLKSLMEGREFDVVVDFLSREPKDIQRVFPLMKSKCKQYVFISSACVYRRSREDFPIKEDSPKPNRLWSYNVEKYECEELLKKLSAEWEGHYTIVRPYITYDSHRIPFGIAPAYELHRTLLERLKSQKPLCLWDGGEALVTLTYAGDFAKGLAGLLMNEKAFDEDFHITSDFTYQWKDVAETLSRKLGVNFQFASCPSSTIAEVMPNEREMLEGDRCLNAVFDNSKIKAAVPDLVFETDLGKGLDIIIDEYGRSDRYEYDYVYDALMDRLCMQQGIRTRYVRYPHAASSMRVVYWLYKYLPYRKARKVAHKLKL